MTLRRRDDFSLKVKDMLAKRVAFRCSNPTCNVQTAGPHSEPIRYVNIGVACHVTAAAAGGPRFDASLTPAERSSIENALWLCQACAKLVDSDSERYPVEMLKGWKVAAEARALRDMKGEGFNDLLPQPAFAIHAAIPRIGGLVYEEARAKLIHAGWQPRMNHFSYGQKSDLQCGNGLYFWQKGFWEIVNAWGTGLSQCLFGFTDVYGNVLAVVTVGEILEELGTAAYVSKWYFSDEDDLASYACL